MCIKCMKLIVKYFLADFLFLEGSPYIRVVFIQINTIHTPIPALPHFW